MMSETNRERIAALAWALALAVVASGCGPGGSRPPPTRGDAGPGRGCQSDQVCQNGLSCQQGVCDFDRCDRAPDPGAWCAERLGLDPERVECDEVSGECRQRQGGFGDACQQPGECAFGLACHEQVCAETCTSSASCPVEGESCRALQGRESVRVCQPSLPCDQYEDPQQHCARELGLNFYEVECAADGACTPERKPQGSFCQFDDQCFEGLCEVERCTSICQEDKDCLSEQVCRLRVGEGEGEVRVCRPRDCIVAPRPDAFCEYELGISRARCDRNEGECVRPVRGERARGVRLKDTTQGAGCVSRVEGAAAPGSDLMYLTLFEPERRQIKGFGVVLETWQGRQGDEIESGYDLLNHLQGTPPPFEVDEATGCPLAEPPFSQRTVYAMGCEGRVYVEFVGLLGEPVYMEVGDVLVIGEFVPMCASGLGQDAIDSLEAWGCGEGLGAGCDWPTVQQRQGAVIAVTLEP